MPIRQSEHYPENQSPARVNREDLTHFTMAELAEERAFLGDNINFADEMISDGDASLDRANDILLQHENTENKNILLQRMLKKLKKVTQRLYDENNQSGLMVEIEEKKLDLENILQMAEKISGQEFITQQNVGNQFELILKRGLNQFVDEDANGKIDSLEQYDRELEKVEKQIDKLIKKIESFSKLSKEEQKNAAKTVITIYLLTIIVGAALTVKLISNVKTEIHPQETPIVDTITPTENLEEESLKVENTIEVTETRQANPSFEEVINEKGSVSNAYYNAVGVDGYNPTDKIVIYGSRYNKTKQEYEYIEIVSGTAADFLSGKYDDITLLAGDDVEIYRDQD